MNRSPREWPPQASLARSRCAPRVTPFPGLRQRSLPLLGACLALAACGTTPRYTAPPPKPAATAPAAAPPVARSGGYYLDDGPGDNPPPNLEAVPDAVPRAEALHRGAARPYMVMGRNYVPMTSVTPYRARGVASWYGRRYHGKLTSTGETYDMYGMSAAHPTLPLPSYVRVTHVANGKSVIVRVNDRGPFIDSRLIDLSYTAAYKLGVLTGGSALVDVELIVPGAPLTTAATAPATPPAPTLAAAATALPPALAAASSESPTAVTAAAAQVPAAPPSATAAVPPVASASAPTASARPITPDATVPPAADRPVPMAAETGGIYLQLAAFGSRVNADAYASRLRADVNWLADRLQVSARDGLFRVRAGPYANSGDARENAERIAQAVRVKPVIQTQ